MANTTPQQSPQSPGTMTVTPGIKTIYSVGIVLGLIIFGATLMQNAERAWHGYVISYFYFVSLALGGLFFTAIQHLTKAGWSVNVRRLSEAMAAFLPVAVVGGIVLLLGAPKVYEWLRPDVVAADAILQHKAAYLNRGFFSVRLLGFLALWWIFARVMVGRSVAQDKTGDEKLTLKQVGISIAFLMTFALSYSLFAVDLLMSMEPHFFSTIYGVYCFAGLFQASMAVMIILIIYLQRKGKLVGFVDDNHLHDLGKFMFAFTVFWAYVAFSQYMLIWYANLPEETFFYLERLEPGWLWVSIGLLLFKFVVPFLALLPRWAKRTHNHLIAVSSLILFMQYVDIYWLAYPTLSEEKAIFGLPEIGSFLLFGGLFLFTLTRFLGANILVPIRDPRIQESLHHHVTY